MVQKDYLTTKVELAHVLAQQKLSKLNKLTSEIELLKFIATMLISIEQRLNER